MSVMSVVGVIATPSRMPLTRDLARSTFLISNAGKSPLYNRPVDISEKLYDSVLDVNLKGPFRLTAVVGQRMVESGGAPYQHL